MVERHAGDGGHPLAGDDVGRIEPTAQAGLEDGEYFECSSCGVFIGFKRLEARPVTMLCIRCKEKQERRERVYAG